MKRVYCLPFLAWGGLSLGLQGPALQAQAQRPGGLVELGGLKSRVPADWMQVPPDDPRYLKQYRLEPIGNDKYSARLTIYPLGKRERGSAAEYVRRWKGMFFPPEGMTMDEAAHVRNLKVPGATVTYLDIRGDYKGIAGDDTTPRQNFRLLGVYFATPKGTYLIRLFGPARTVAFYRKGFEDWVKGFE